jgi:hypothetical protein
LSNLNLPTRSQVTDRLTELEKARLTEAIFLHRSLGDEDWKGWGGQVIIIAGSNPLPSALFQSQLYELRFSLTQYGAKILSLARTRNVRLPVIFVDDTSQDISSTNPSYCVTFQLGSSKLLI